MIVRDEYMLTCFTYMFVVLSVYLISSLIPFSWMMIWWWCIHRGKRVSSLAPGDFIRLCSPSFFIAPLYIHVYNNLCLMITVKYVINITLFPFRTFLNEPALSVYHHSSYNRLKVSWNSLVCWAKVKGINQEKMSLWKILRMTF